MSPDRVVPPQFGQNIFCKPFTQFNAPLVETEDIPDHTLNENLMFIQGDQRTERSWIEFLKENGIGRFIALKDLKGEKLCNSVFWVTGSC